MIFINITNNRLLTKDLNCQASYYFQENNTLYYTILKR